MSRHQFTVAIEASDRIEAYRILGKTLADAAMGGAGRMPPANRISIELPAEDASRYGEILAARKAAQDKTDMEGYQRWCKEHADDPAPPDSFNSRG